MRFVRRYREHLVLVALLGTTFRNGKENLIEQKYVG